MTSGAIRLCNFRSKHVHPDSENPLANLKGASSGPRPADSDFPSFCGAPTAQIPRRHLALPFAGNFDMHMAAQTGEKRSKKRLPPACACRIRGALRHFGAQNPIPVLRYCALTAGLFRGAPKLFGDPPGAPPDSFPSCLGPSDI